MRKANWTDDQTLHLLALINDRKQILKGSLSPALTARMKQDALNETVTLINASHAMVARTRAECEKRWYTVLSKAKERISSYKKGVVGTGE